MEACESGVEELRKKLLEQGRGDDDDDEYLAEDTEGDVMYSQGFDWIHDSASVMYEEEGDVFYDDEEEYNFEEANNFNEGSMPKQSIRSLKKLAKEMEEKGEF